jgi:hypothetical protein
MAAVVIWAVLIVGLSGQAVYLVVKARRGQQF